LAAAPWLYFVVFFILILLSAFFSGSESAYFSIPQIEISRLRKQKEKSGAIKRVLFLLEKPRRLLLSILVGNTIVNVGAATVAALFTSKYVPEGHIGKSGSLILEIIIVTIVILIFSEVSPKIFAVKRSLQFAIRVSLPLSAITRILIPITFVFDKLALAVSTLLGVEKEIPFADEEDLKTLFEVGEENGALDKNEREMIHSIFEFSETIVKEVMVPRMDMISLEKNTPIDAVLSLVKEKGHSRIPVYDNKIDEISGILFVKDLLPYMQGKKEIPALIDLMRKPYFVPESKGIDELLRDFQKERVHMAIVVDEYGGTAGLITLEDVIEEIVGEIRDEYDREKPLIHQVNENTWLVDGKIDIEDLNENLSLKIPAEEDYESLGGFIFSLMGRIPQVKEEVRFEDLLLIVEKVQGQRIQKVRLVRQKLTQDPDQIDHN
jgi:putative hemolysin